MVLFVTGLAAASSSFSELNWEPNQEYTFEYRGRLLTGIPELASQYSGVGMKCLIHLQVQAANKFALKIQNAQYTKVNSVLNSGDETIHGSSGNFEESNWRNLQLPAYQPISGESAQMLSMPTMFQMAQGGVIEHITLSKDEPEWSVNFKKAIVVLFQTQNSHGASALETNTVSTSTTYYRRSGE